jgi:hypothetical protein
MSGTPWFNPLQRLFQLHFLVLSRMQQPVHLALQHLHFPSSALRFVISDWYYVGLSTAISAVLLAL